MQLAAQSICLEEMFSTDIREGTLFYGETRRRENVKITEELKQQVKIWWRRCTNIITAGILQK